LPAKAFSPNLGERMLAADYRDRLVLKISRLRMPGSGVGRSRS
jgi:hypothetical protein